MANLVSTTITGTLNTTSTITGPGSGVSAINASNVSSGTLSNDRLDTVPTTKGGTGLTTIGSAGQVLKVSAPGTALEFGDAGGGGDYVQTFYTGPATYAPPATLKAVKVTVVGGGGTAGQTCRGFQAGKGGNGGAAFEYIPVASIPGPVAITAGSGTNSFGAFVSATGGGNGTQGWQASCPGSTGAGSGGQFNSNFSTSTNMVALGLGLQAGNRDTSPSTQGPGYPGCGYGGGGGGGATYDPGANNVCPGGSGASGVVIVEEFF